MSETYRFLTTKHEHLFGLAKFLIGGIDPAFFEVPLHPVIITVRGSTGSGKKIIFDAAKDALLGKEAEFEGRKDLDEYYSATRNGRRISADYIDAAYGHGYSKKNIYSHDGDPHGVAVSFLCLRHGPGLVVLQNDLYRGAWIDILVDAKLYSKPFPRRSDSWDRQIDVTIHEPALLESPAFRQRLEMIKSAYVEPLSRYDIPAWGVHLPRRKIT